MTTGPQSSAAHGGTIGGDYGVTIGGRGHHIEGGIHIINKLGQIDEVDSSVRRELTRIYGDKVRNYPENAQYHLALGLSYLDLGIYDQARQSLQTALSKGPRQANTYYYLALAAIAGNRPKTLRLSDVRTIEKYLDAAVQLDDHQAHFLYLWALLKYDYYHANGLLDSPPP